MVDINNFDENNEKIIQQDEDIIDSENGLIFNPYNPINKEITNNTIQNILTKYGINHKITNFELYLLCSAVNLFHILYTNS